MDAPTEHLPNVAEALARAVDTRASRERDLLGELEALGAERERLRVAILSLEAQRAALDPIEAEVRAELTSLDDGAHEVLFNSLIAQRAAVAARAELVAEAARAQRDAARETTDNIDALLVEYRQFRDVIEPTLPDLPATYRSVLKAHHDGVVSRLRQFFSRVGADPVPLDAPALDLDVVIGVDGDGAEAVGVTIAIPVSGDVRAATLEGAPELELTLAARVVQAIYEGLDAIGQPTAVTAFGDHRGLLVVEVEVEPTDRADLVDQLLGIMEDVLGTSAELLAAGVRVRALEVPADHLFPPEESSDTLEDAS